MCSVIILLIKCFSVIRPAVVIEVDTVSDADAETIKEAVEKALLEAVSDGTVGILNVDPDSVALMQPHVEETPNGW